MPNRSVIQNMTEQNLEEGKRIDVIKKHLKKHKRKYLLGAGVAAGLGGLEVYGKIKSDKYNQLYKDKVRKIKKYSQDPKNYGHIKDDKPYFVDEKNPQRTKKLKEMVLDVNKTRKKVRSSIKLRPSYYPLKAFYKIKDSVIK